MGQTRATNVRELGNEGMAGAALTGAPAVHGIQARTYR